MRKPSWKQLYQESVRAVEAMRNDINEVIPMESSEATLGLRGPEVGHTCEAIVEAVHAAARRGCV